jgi:hypothetical protein
MSGTAEVPARKRAKYVSWTSADKIWLLDLSKKIIRMSYEDLGEALSVEFNAKVTDASADARLILQSHACENAAVDAAWSVLIMLTCLCHRFCMYRGYAFKEG